LNNHQKNHFFDGYSNGISIGMFHGNIVGYMKSKNITQLYWGYNLQQIILEVMLQISDRGHLPTAEGGAHLAIGWFRTPVTCWDYGRYVYHVLELELPATLDQLW